MERKWKKYIERGTLLTTKFCFDVTDQTKREKIFQNFKRKLNHEEK